MLDGEGLARGVDRFDRRRLEQRNLARQRGKGVGEQPGDPRQPGEVARPAVDRRPGLDLVEHRLGGGALDASCSVFDSAPIAPS